MSLPEGAKNRDLSYTHSSSEPPVYIRLLYKLINVINRPGRIAWESVFCAETVSILNEREGESERDGERGGEREREISTFFFLPYCSFAHPHLPTLSSVLPSVLEGISALQSARIRQNSRGAHFTLFSKISMT